MAPKGFMTSSGHRLVEEVSRRAQHLHEGQAMQQERVPIAELKALIDKKVNLNNLLRNL